MSQNDYGNFLGLPCVLERFSMVSSFHSNQERVLLKGTMLVSGQKVLEAVVLSHFSMQVILKSSLQLLMWLDGVS